MKNKLLFVVFSIVFTHGALANSSHTPTKCPSVQALQSTQFSVSSDINKSWFARGQEDFYDTKQMWELLITNIPAANTQDALNKAKAALNTLTLQSVAPEPLHFPDAPTMWICTYRAAAGYNVTATMD